MKHFDITEDTTVESLRAEYLRLCKKYHPDTGENPSHKSFQEVVQEYQKVFGYIQKRDMSCKSCGGVGKMRINGIVVFCKSCKGKGTI